MPNLLGGFSDPPLITTDGDPKKSDPYIKAEVIPSRYTGANFKVGRPKKGHGKDVYFSKEYPTFASSEQNKGKTDDFLDPGVLERRQAKEKKKKNIDPNRDFKYASPPKVAVGSGSYFGTFDGKPIPHQEEYKVQKRGEPTPKKDIKAPKNILTSPAKKGTYGYLGTTFGTFEGPKVSDEFDAIRKREQAEWKKSKEKMIGSGVFKNTIRTQGLFDEKGATGVSTVYDHFDPPEEKKSKKKAKKPEDKSAKSLEGRPVFRMSSGPRSGVDGCLNKFPNVRDDKPDPYDSAALKAKEDKKKGPGFIGGTWKPVSGPKQGVVRSLLRKYY